MNQLTTPLRHALFVRFIGGIVCLFSVVTSPIASADEPHIWKIEEDWELVINDPEPVANSPQVTFFTSPSVHYDDVYFQLQMNYKADDDYSAGGFHVAAVNGDVASDEARSRDRSILSVDGDVIRWTSVMAIIEDELLFAVKDGHSTEWGDFGGPQYLVRMMTDSISDLSEYSPSQSIHSVDIGFGANRVSGVSLREVRAFDSAGNVITLTAGSSQND